MMTSEAQTKGGKCDNLVKSSYFESDTQTFELQLNISIFYFY